MKNFAEINKPLDKLTFFQNTMILLVVQIFFTILYWLLTTFVMGIKSILWLPLIFIIFIEIPILFLYFIQCGRRIYSILGVFNISVICNIALSVISLIGLLYIPFLALLIYVALLLLPQRGVDE